MYQCRHIGTRVGTLDRMRQQFEHETMRWELLHLKLHPRLSSFSMQLALPVEMSSRVSA